MASITQVPVSILIILNRIDYWEKMASKTPCPAFHVHCEAMIAEMELIKQLVKDK